MTNEETILREYRNARYALEDREDQLNAGLRQAESMVEDALSHVRYFLQDLEKDQDEIFRAVHQKMKSYETEFLEEMQVEKRKVQQDFDLLEENLRRDLRTVN